MHGKSEMKREKNVEQRKTPCVAGLMETKKQTCVKHAANHIGYGKTITIE